MMKRLIVHIGIHKTGTSSIQDSLALNLDDPGFEYISLGAPNGSLALSRAFDDGLLLRPALAATDLRQG